MRTTPLRVAVNVEPALTVCQWHRMSQRIPVIVRYAVPNLRLMDLEDLS